MRRHTTLVSAAVGLLFAACGDGAVPGLGGTSSGSGGAGGEGGGAACPANGFLRGPWALRVDATSAVVRWDGCAPAPAEVLVAPEDGGDEASVTGTQTAAELTTSYDALQGVPPDLPGTYYLSEVALTGLAPATCYRYAIAAEPEAGGRFCTARPSGSSFRFLAIGDTNPTLGDSTMRVLDAVLPEKPDFIVHVGDIQYYASLFESWSAWFPIMSPLLRAGAFQPAIGNHESEIPGEYEDYYLRYFGGAGFDGDDEHYRFESGGVWFFSLDTEESLDAGSPQAEWLEAELADAAAQPGFRFSIVYFHKPFITLSEYSQDKAARQHFAPIFLANGVRLVLQGHVHGYERFEENGLAYITTGGGGAKLHDLDVSIADRPEEAAERVASAAVHHAIVLDVDGAGLHGRGIGEDGALVDEWSY